LRYGERRQRPPAFEAARRMRAVVRQAEAARQAVRGAQDDDVADVAHVARLVQSSQARIPSTVVIQNTSRSGCGACVMMASSSMEAILATDRLNA
jgi:hypothetical protein